LFFLISCTSISNLLIKFSIWFSFTHTQSYVYFFHHHRDFIFFFLLFISQSNSKRRIKRNSINYKLTMDWIFFYFKTCYSMNVCNIIFRTSNQLVCWMTCWIFPWNFYMRGKICSLYLLEIANNLPYWTDSRRRLIFLYFF